MALVLVGCLVLVACASIGNLWIPYSVQMQASRQALIAGQPALAMESLPASGEPLLEALEAGRLAFVMGQWEASRSAFATAIELLEQQREQARIRVSAGLRQTASMLSNDTVIAYQAPAYERVMAHHYQALNYLFLGNLEGALVEVRRANMEQEAALEEHQQELSEAANSSHDQQQLARVLEQSGRQLPSMATIIGDLKSSFQNAYTFYTSGMLYELAGSPDDAYIDYKRALEIYPDNEYLQKDVMRLAIRLDMVDDLRRFEQQFGIPAGTAPKAGWGDLVVLYEAGLVPVKQATDLTLPVQHGNGGWSLFRISLPIYNDSGIPASPLSLRVGDIEGNSEPIADLSRMSAKALEESYPAIVGRQLLRVLSKEQLRQAARQGAGEWGELLSNLYNALSEQADTRSWLTLPHNAQIWRARYAPGRVRLQVPSREGQQMLPVEISAGRLSLVMISEVNGHLFTKVYPDRGE